MVITTKYKPVRTYFDLCNEGFSNIIQETYNEQFDDVFTESIVLLEAWEMKKLVLEGPVEIAANKTPITQKNVQGNINRVKNFFGKILDFIVKMLSRFDDFISNVFKTDAEWFNEHVADLMPNQLPKEVLNTMKLTVVPYWQNRDCMGRLNESGYPMNGSLKLNFEKIGADPSMNTSQRLYEAFFPKLKQIDGESWKNASVMYYRGGQQPEMRNIEGKGNITEALGGMIQFIRDENAYQQKAKQVVTAVEKEIKSMQNQIKSLSATESYSFGAGLYSVLEECSLFESEFNNFPILDSYGNQIKDIMMEAEMTATTAAANNNQNQNDNKPNDKSNQTDSNKKDDKKAQEDAQRKEQKDNLTNCINLCRMVITVVSARLTIIEEIHKSYMKTLHGVYDGLRTFKERNDEEQENIDYNQKQKDEQKQRMANHRANAKEEKAAAKDNNAVEREKKGGGIIRRGFNWLFG